MRQLQAFSSFAFFLYLAIFILQSLVSSKPDGFSLELIHRDSPESPFHPGKLTDSERISRLVEFSKIKADNPASYLTSNSSFNPETFRPGLSNDGVTYLVKLLIGSPGIPLFLLPDTGSHLFWTQCEPCTHRYHQLPPVFNSTTSHSFRELTCHSPFCQNNKNIFQCRNDRCVYSRRYEDGSTTSGIASQDILQSTNNNNDRIPFYFGCSRDNRNFGAFEHTGKSGGIMGLSMSPVSILQQLGHITKRRFSYCFNPLQYNSPQQAISFLRFGNDIRIRGRRFLSTPFVSPPNDPLYFLNLLDISVGGHRLHIPQGTFALKPNGTGGTIIDSGTTVTFIVQPAYSTVVSGFMVYFRRRVFQRVHLPETHLDVCYNTGHANYSFHDFPSLTFHFQGADFLVKPENVYMTFNEYPGAFCLALKSTTLPRRTIIGAVNQANTRFIYDAADRKLLFISEDCHLDV